MEDYTISSGNVFKDIGFEDAEERFAKAKLAAIINKIIEKNGFAQKEAAKILGINQSEIEALNHGRLKNFSIDRLFSFLQSLDQHIEITITDKSKVKTDQVINVAYV
jgi:predicted XRE-type DNA-binding protein